MRIEQLRVLLWRRPNTLLDLLLHPHLDRLTGLLLPYLLLVQLLGIWLH